MTTHKFELDISESKEKLLEDLREFDDVGVALAYLADLTVVRQEELKDTLREEAKRYPLQSIFAPVLFCSSATGSHPQTSRRDVSGIASASTSIEGLPSGVGAAGVALGNS